MKLYNILLYLLFTFGISTAADYYVKTAQDISDAMAVAQPGDTLTMANGVWHDSYITFSGDGEEGKPILLRAETPGFVNLTGIATLRIGGTYLVVDGLRFINGRSNSSAAIIEFRTSTSNPAHHCRLTNTGIINYNPESIGTNYKWVSMYGSYNRVDHCYFYGKNHDAATLVIWFDRVANPPAHYHRIDHNYFGYRPDWALMVVKPFVLVPVIIP